MVASLSGVVVFGLFGGQLWALDLVVGLDLDLLCVSLLFGLVCVGVFTSDVYLC